MALEEPTINEFASFVNISSPNAAYKVNSLIQKGYVEKIAKLDTIDELNALLQNEE